jgi:hypothetical protein
MKTKMLLHEMRNLKVRVLLCLLFTGTMNRICTVTSCMSRQSDVFGALLYLVEVILLQYQINPLLHL